LNKKAKGEILGILYRFSRFSPKVCCGGGKKRISKECTKIDTPNGAYLDNKREGSYGKTGN
jgi:hypothetical protein